MYGVHRLQNFINTPSKTSHPRRLRPESESLLSDRRRKPREEDRCGPRSRLCVNVVQVCGQYFYRKCLLLCMVLKLTLHRSALLKQYSNVTATRTVRILFLPDLFKFPVSIFWNTLILPRLHRLTTFELCSQSIIHPSAISPATPGDARPQLDPPRPSQTPSRRGSSART